MSVLKGNRRWLLKGATAAVSAGATLGIAEAVARTVFHTSFIDRGRVALSEIGRRPCMSPSGTSWRRS